MPKTDIVKIYRSKGNSDTLAVVIVRISLKLERGDMLKASVDSKSEIILYQRVTKP